MATEKETLVALIKEKGLKLISSSINDERRKGSAEETFTLFFGKDSINIGYLENFVKVNFCRIHDFRIEVEVAKLMAMIEVYHQFEDESPHVNTNGDELKQFPEAEEAELALGAKSESDNAATVGAARKAIEDYLYQQPDSTVEKYLEVRRILIKLDSKDSVADKVAYLKDVLAQDSVIDQHQNFPFFNPPCRGKTETRKYLEALLIDLEAPQSTNMTAMNPG